MTRPYQHSGHDLDDEWCHTCCVQVGEPEPRRCPECNAPEPYLHKSDCSSRGQYLPEEKEKALQRISEIKAHAAWLVWDRWATASANGPEVTR